MISMIERHKRTLILLSLSALLLIAAVTLLEHGLELSGISFMIAALATLLYLPLFWLFVRKKEAIVVQGYLQKEYWPIAAILVALCLLAAVEASRQYLVFTIIFVEILLLLLIYTYTHRLRPEETRGKKKGLFPTWVYGLIFIGNGIIIVFFEDDFKDKEQFGIAMLCYFLTVLIMIFNWFFKQIKTIIDLRNEQTRTELLHLQSQVNPHFFFNMLNNLYGWVGKDTKTAQELILKLSDLMRYSIYEGQKDEVTIEEEINYLKNYIDLHRSRYHKKIEVSFTTDIQEPSVSVMPLLFIILLENAFKHGVENLRENAYVKVHLRANEEEVYCEVENNFEPIDEIKKRGIGLKNLRRRLELVYPDKHNLSLSTDNNIYKAQLTIRLT